MSIDIKILSLYDEAVNRIDGLKRKGKTVPYTSANGYMFSILNKENQLGIRLSKDEQAKFKSIYDSGIFMSHGAVMRDYVLVPESMLTDSELLAKYIKMSWNFVNTLPPK
ncbi:MAG: hypothetical protein ACPGLV_00390 [Bacteroidia bacterium]